MVKINQSFKLMIFVLLIWSLFFIGKAAAATPQIHVAGQVETVYDWKWEHCDRWTVPDAPARAFVRSDRQVTLIAANAANWYMVGAELNKVRTVCSSAFQSGDNPDPLAFNGQGWIEGTFTEDGRTVVGLISNDWWPVTATSQKKRTAGCPLNVTTGCHFYSVSLVLSHDAGRTFSLVSPGHPLAARSYAEMSGKRRVIGFATATNLIPKDGFIYVLLGSRDADRERSGSCLFRAKSPAILTSWEYWDGKTFQTIGDASDTSPLTANCAPVAVPFPAPVEFRSVSFFSECQCYIGLFEGFQTKTGGKSQNGFFATTSSTLTSWTDPELVVSRPEDRECKPMLVYPSMLDPASEDRNFATVDARPYIYFTRINRTRCAGTTDRDLVRVPVQIQFGEWNGRHATVHQH